MTLSGSSRRILLPLALVLVVAACWSIYWYIASEKAKQSFAKYVEKNRQAGIEIDCAEPVWGGYPFRFELDCRALKATARRGGVDIDFAAAATSAVALAYNPFHLIVDLAGPISLTVKAESGRSTRIVSNGKPLRASMKLERNPNRADQVSVLAQALTGTITRSGGPDGGEETVPFTVGRLNLHWRFAGEPVGKIAPFDIALDMTDYVYGPDTSTLFRTEPLRVETASMAASMTAVPFAKGQTFSQRARTWHRGGGRVAVEKFNFTSNFLTGKSSGNLNLDAEGRLNGKLEGRVSGFDEFLARLETAGIIKKNQAAIADTLMSVLGKPDQENAKPSIKITTTFKKGKLYFGPFKVAEIPPLF